MEAILNGLALILGGVALLAAVAGVTNTEGSCDEERCEDCPFPCEKHRKEE